jgi:hypothetical protein
MALYNLRISNNKDYYPAVKINKMDDSIAANSVLYGVGASGCNN